MMATSIADKIRLKQLQVSTEQDPQKKQLLQKQLTKLRLRLELQKFNQWLPISITEYQTI